MYIVITNYLKGKENIQIKLQINTGNNDSLIGPKCLVLKVSFLRIFDSKKQGQLELQLSSHSVSLIDFVTFNV